MVRPYPAETEKVNAESDCSTGVVHKGDIFLLYRPEVQEEDDPEGLAEVQRFHVVLRPQGGSMPLRAWSQLGHVTEASLAGTVSHHAR